MLNRILGYILIQTKIKSNQIHNKTCIKVETKMEISRKNKTILVVLGCLSGFINGFLGGGGGVLVLATLLSVLKLHQKSAQATALLVILPLTVVSAAVYVIQGAVDWMPTLWATIGVVVGGIVGALLLSKLKGNTAKIIFAVVLISGGVKMLF